MKVSLGHWCVGLFAAALLLPAGLPAQAPPQVASPDWMNETVQQSIAQARNGMARLMETIPQAGWLGVSVSEVTTERAQQAKLPRAEGVFVDEVEADSPAAKAGLRANDTVVEYNGQAVEGVLEFERLVRETPPGRTVSMEVVRGGSRQRLSAQVESRRTLIESRMEGMQNRMQDMPHAFALMRPMMAQPLLGIRGEEVSGQLGRYFQAPDGRGVLVVEVTAGSPADKAGLKAGDVIYQAASKPTRTVGELELALRENCSSEGVPLQIVRKGLTLSLRAQIECPPAPGARRSNGYAF